MRGLLSDAHRFHGAFAVIIVVGLCVSVIKACPKNEGAGGEELTFPGVGWGELLTATAVHMPPVGDHVQRLGIVALRHANRLVNAVAHVTLKITAIHLVPARGDRPPRCVYEIGGVVDVPAGRGAGEVVVGATLVVDCGHLARAVHAEGVLLRHVRKAARGEEGHIEGYVVAGTSHFVEVAGVKREQSANEAVRSHARSTSAGEDVANARGGGAYCGNKEEEKHTCGGGAHTRRAGPPLLGTKRH